MKNFAVYSTDKALLKAFEQKLKEAGYESDEEQNYDAREYKSYLHTSHDESGSGLFAYYSHGDHTNHVYTLPEEWNEAVKNLKEYKENDWVWVYGPEKGGKGNGLNHPVNACRLIPLDKEPPSTSGNLYENADWVAEAYDDGEKYYQRIKEEHIVGRIDHEKLKEILIDRSGLKIGGKVKFENKGTYTVQNFKLITRPDGIDQSHKCNQYFKEVGMHLAVRDAPFSYPADLCEKVDESFLIKTDQGELAVSYRQGSFKVGCEEISLGFLTNLVAVANRCDSEEYRITIDQDGSILEFDTLNGKIKKKVSIDTLRQILKKANQ